MVDLHLLLDGYVWDGVSVTDATRNAEVVMGGIGSGPPRVASVTKRFEATRQLRIEHYWMTKHREKRARVALDAINAGQTYDRIALIMGVHVDTLFRAGIRRGNSYNDLKLNKHMGI
jgi:hypothetical protein